MVYFNGRLNSGIDPQREYRGIRRWNLELQRLQSQMTRCVYPECKRPACDMAAKSEVTVYKLNLIMMNEPARLCLQVERGTMLLSTNQWILSRFKIGVACFETHIPSRNDILFHSMLTVDGTNTQGM